MKTKAEHPDLLPPLLIFTRQFALLFQQGVMLRNCCVLLGEDAPQPYAEFAGQLRERAEAGKTVFEAMSISDYLFPPLYLAMIKAGEVGGVLGEFLGYLAELLDEEWKFRQQGALGEDDMLLFAPLVQGPKEWHDLSDARRLMTVSLWCRTMSMLLSARVPLEIALLTSAKILPPKQQQWLQQDAKQKELIPVLHSANFLPATALTLISLGYQEGTLDLVLDQLAQLYHDMFRYTRVKPSKRLEHHATTGWSRRMIATPSASPDLDMILRAAGMPELEVETISIDKGLGNIIPHQLQKRHHAAPLRLMGNRLVVAMANPEDAAALDDFRLVTGREITPVHATDKEIEKIRQQQQEPSMPDWSELEQEMSGTGGGSPIIRIVNVIIQNAITQGATEILLDSNLNEVRIHYCLEGEFHEVMTLPKFAHLPLLERLKIMADIPLDAEPPQQGSIYLRNEGQEYDAFMEVTAGEFVEVVTLRIVKRLGLECGG